MKRRWFAYWDGVLGDYAWYRRWQGGKWTESERVFDGLRFTTFWMRDDPLTDTESADKKKGPK